MAIVNKLLSLLRKESKVENPMPLCRDSDKIRDDYEVKILSLIGSFIAYEWIESGLENKIKTNLAREDTRPLSLAVSREGDCEGFGNCKVTGYITSELNDLVITITSVRKKGYLKSFSVTINEINGQHINLSFNQAPFYSNPGLTMIDITKKVTEDISLLFNKD